ncbi:MAG: helix-turn-helix domain-containing protein [Mogibacterium sp.]|nr:helix-turn-helix domain-containing protein [Mogibacterium sp.]
MGLTRRDKKNQAHFRQKKILELVSEPGGMSCTRLAERFSVTRGDIINDIRDLRAMGYTIQTSMTTEDKMYTALFELQRTPKSPS